MGMTMTDLKIETTRLTLRAFSETDARRLAYLAGDYDVAKMCGRVPHPYPVLVAEGWIAMQSASRNRGEEFPFAVTLPRDGLIGACGVTRVELRLAEMGGDAVLCACIAGRVAAHTADQSVGALAAFQRVVALAAIQAVGV